MNIDRPREEQIPALRRLWREAFGDTDAFLDIFWQSAYSPDRCRCVTVDGELAAALYWFDCQHEKRPIAYLYAVATAKAYRGRGICHRLMEDTHRHLAAQGYAGAILVPGDEGLFLFYARMGYRTCASVRSVACEGREVSLAVSKIGRDEYAERRRNLMPCGGVVQEGVNLLFLEKQADFYAGEGFVLAAHRDRDKLIGIELLGNPDAAPAVVHALGCRQGSFRMPGDGMPFAMYLPFDGGALPLPAYFGLAFD